MSRIRTNSPLARNPGPRIGAIRTRIAGLLLAMQPVLGAGHPVTYRMDSGHSFADFFVKVVGVWPLHGRFTRMRGVMELDRPTRSGTIRVDIDTTSASTDFNAGDSAHAYDALLRSRTFLDAGRFPRASFRSIKVDFDGEKPTAVEGTLRLLGVDQPVTLSVGSFSCTSNTASDRDTCSAEAHTTFRRSAFRMTNLGGLVSDQVEIVLHIQAEAERGRRE